MFGTKKNWVHCELGRLVSGNLSASDARACGRIYRPELHSQKELKLLVAMPKAPNSFLLLVAMHLLLVDLVA